MELLANMSADDVAAELRAARIYETRTGVASDDTSAVAGHLGPFKFERRWCYWTARGPMPTSAAIRLYEDPVGRKDIRVNGHCGRPPPDERMAVVSAYHIDSVVGLRLFADTIREIGFHPEGLSPRVGR